MKNDLSQSSVNYLGVASFEYKQPPKLSAFLNKYGIQNIHEALTNPNIPVSTTLLHLVFKQIFLTPPALVLILINAAPRSPPTTPSKIAVGTIKPISVFSLFAILPNFTLVPDHEDKPLPFAID
jgi:hypothetical protein